ncbi:hypothetical protein DFH07DRAFT_936980 [Mycena maculata]|uniref:EF-hand domain-containing protein n=1 Tax=Mycena maculata TaxID=230809 RepID=A0AAD7K0W6_9AGAR|nr:hypothetical protein DFH07DRAFT_936980 [Mycena maculata]
MSYGGQQYGPPSGAPPGAHRAPQQQPGAYGPPAGAPPPQGVYAAPHGAPHAGPPGYGAPPRGDGYNPRAQDAFSRVDKDRSGSISVEELQEALVNRDWTTFDPDTVKLLMNMFDTDRSGKIGFNEFHGLWKYIEDWQAIFKHFDQDNSGTINERELGGALAKFGFNLQPHSVKLVLHKYGTAAAPTPAAGGFVVQQEGQGGLPLTITFDHFIRACVSVKQASEAFQKLDTDRDGWVQINYEQFMGTVLSLPSPTKPWIRKYCRCRARPGVGPAFLAGLCVVNVLNFRELDQGSTPSAIGSDEFLQIIYRGRLGSARHPPFDSGPSHSLLLGRLGRAWIEADVEGSVARRASAFRILPIQYTPFDSGPRHNIEIDGEGSVVHGAHLSIMVVFYFYMQTPPVRRLSRGRAFIVKDPETPIRG